MWFFLTRQIVFTKRLAASRDKVLAALDPDTVLGGNSILTSVIPDAGNANAAPGAVLGFTIVEKVPLVFGLSTSTKFHCQWTNVADGADLEVNAGAGTHLATRLRASEDVDAGETEYSDHVTVTGFFLFMPFIVSRATRSHTILRDLIAQKTTGTTASTSTPSGST